MTTETHLCRCNECRKSFNEDLIVEQHYTEYPGASTQPMFVSPCCFADYEEIREG